MKKAVGAIIVAVVFALILIPVADTKEDMVFYAGDPGTGGR